MRTPPAHKTPVLQLQLHGAAQVQPLQGPALALRGRAAALVALAALRPGICRELAAGMLWPDAANPRHNLRQQLLRFRQSLGQPLVEGDDGLRLAADVQLRAPAPGADLLAGEPAGHDHFGVWLQAQRRALRLAQQAPLLRLLAQAEADGDLPQALQHAQVLVQLDPQDEASHAALMRVHFLRGDGAAGLAAYQVLLQQLAALADADAAVPSAATQNLAASLRRLGQAPSLVVAGVRLLPASLTRPPVLAGRSAELAAVAAAWAAGCAALLEGEAGMGKTRLLSDCLAGRPGAHLQAAGRPGDSGAPYSSLARLVAPLLHTSASGLEPTARSALVHLGAPHAWVEAPDAAVAAVGATAAGSSSGPGMPTLTPGALQAAVQALLIQAGVRTVALDDLHFADAATLDLLSGLAAQPLPWQWLFAQRPAEAPAAASALRSSLTELQRLRIVALSPLTRQSAADLIDALDVRGLSGHALAPQLVQHSGGNPLFLLETLKQGLQDGSLAQGRLPRPASAGALITQRLHRLSPPALALARVAAIAGVDFCIELAEAAIGQRAVQLASAWQELQHAQILHDEALAHDLVADAVLQGVPAVVARRLHAQCAAWLAEHQGEPARVARHWRAGGQAQQAAAAFEQAARRARDAARQPEEADLYAQAALAYGDAGLPDARFDALANRVSALIGAQSDDAALAEARALPDQAGNAVQRVRALRVLADQLGQRGPFDEAITIGQQGMALAAEVGAQDELVRLASLTAGNQIKIGRTQDAYALMLPLREWVDREAGDEVRQIWYGYWAAVLGHTGRLREGVASYDVSIGCAERLGARANQCMALLNQCVVLRTMGALPLAIERSRRALQLLPDASDLASDSANHRLARLMHARNEAETGLLGPAQQALDTLLPQFEAMGAPFWVQAVRQTQARLWQHLGQHARAQQALQADDAGLPAWMQAGRLWLQLEVAQWLGVPMQAAQAAQVQQALALLDADPNRRTGNLVRGLRFATPAATLAQADTLLAAALNMELFGLAAALHMHHARAALAVQRPAEAGLAARALLRLLHDGQVPDFVYTPEAWLVAAQALQAAGDSGAASSALAAGRHWVQAVALPQVPAPFVDSFLHRNPINRTLLLTLP